MPAGEHAQAEAILRAVDYWHYPFELPWGRVSPTKPGHDDRHALRRRHFFQPLLDRYGGSLAGKTVLDLGCCQGYWSFEAVRTGAESSIGIDASDAFLREAGALAVLFDLKHRCAFRRAQIEEDPWWRDVPNVDVTLALGLFYYLTDPILVLRKALGRTRETFVIDTETVVADSAILRVMPQVESELTVRGVRLSSGVRTLFSRLALIALLRAEGFSDITELAPAPNMPAEYHGYGDCIRLSMIARRR
jgi:SAM-dependent methyltransferase